jgi:YHS domain-containing protein
VKWSIWCDVMAGLLTAGLASAGLATTVAAASLPAGAQGDTAPPDVFRDDAVALCRDGERRPGDEAIFLDRAGYRYLFISAANRDEFLAHPHLYEVQMGGACARMGEFSGRGRPEINAVHDGRLYIFASVPCHERFLKSPDLFLFSPESIPTATTEEAARGRALLDRVIARLGGAETVDSIDSVRSVQRSEDASQNPPAIVTNTVTFRFPDSYRVDDSWNDSHWGRAVTRDDAWFIDGRDEPPRAMHPQARAAMELELHHDFIAAIQSRSRDDFIAADAGEAEVDGVNIRRLRLSFCGTMVTLGVEPDTGRVRSIAYRGRGPNLTVGDLRFDYADEKEVRFAAARGERTIALPHAATAFFNNLPAPSLDRAWDEIAINADVAEAFERE